MQTNNDWTKQYYNDEAQRLITERGKQWNPELQKKAEADWGALYRDIESAAERGADPLGPEGQALVARQKKLVEGFTGGHAVIEEGLGKLWADKANWPDGFKQQMVQTFAKQGLSTAQGNAPRLMSEKAEAFFAKACAAGKR